MHRSADHAFHALTGRFLPAEVCDMTHVRAILYSMSLVATVCLAATPLAVQAADNFPNACVSCHVVDKAKGQDHRLSTLLKGWTAGKVDADLLAKTKASMPTGVAAKGKHPAADDALEDIPSSCLDCHGPDSKKAPSFTRLMHLVHLTGPKNEFVTTFKGDCTACHKLNATTGEWSIPSGPEK
jgi:cytochrome c553